MNISDWIRPNIAQMTPYSSAREEHAGSSLVQLDANENPYGSAYHRYPDPHQTELRQWIARQRQLPHQQLILGNGSDEIIDWVIRVFCAPGEDEIVGVKPSYGMYKVSASVNNVVYREVGLNRDFSLNPAALLEAITPRTKVVFLCSPGNPSGNLIDANAIELLLEQFDGIVVIDEAYGDFSEHKSWSCSLSKYPQLIVLQTFSKLYGLAGIRLGLAWADTAVIDVFNKIKPPYNVNQLTQQVAIQKLKQADSIQRERKMILQTRSFLEKALQHISIVTTVFPSDANFLLVRFKDAENVYHYLKDRGVLVRDRSQQYGCENCLRITVGTPQEVNQLIQLLHTYP